MMRTAHERMAAVLGVCRLGGGMMKNDESYRQIKKLRRLREVDQRQWCLASADSQSEVIRCKNMG